jgi:23S rRNA (uracil1939-C5)-methyltransferase
MHIGFYRQGTHFVEDAPEGCPIALPVINQALASLRNVLQAFPEQNMLPQINIDCAGDGLIAVVNYIGREIDATAAFFNRHLKELQPLTGLYLQTGRKSTLRKVYGDDLLKYSLPDCHNNPCLLSYKPGGFSQVNSVQNHKLLELVRRLSAFRGDERVLDLYCGNGNFSLPLAGDVAAMTGIEEYADSISAALENARKNDINNAEFICSDAVAAVRKLAESGTRFDVVILDPPRSGAGDAVAEICRLNPDKIVYISCDPSTLARDCSVLTRHGAYQVKISIPVDMFPQTYHLESVTLLQRS